MKKVKLMLVGGFLGAGKTTALISLAGQMQKSGLKVAFITNDQGTDLVDSASIRELGFPVMEVTKGCFCCNFNEFIDRINKLIDDYDPDVILAEPVGSCTDLIATIMKPLNQDTKRSFFLSPLSVMVDPKRLDSLCKDGVNTFHRREISYLFVKQLEEADLIILNKTDLLTKEELDKYQKYLTQNFPKARILCVSAMQHQGIQEWISASDESYEFIKPSLNIEYDTYAQAEAALGWLNTAAELQLDTGFLPDDFIFEMASAIQSIFLSKDIEIAHMKMCIISNTDYSKISCIGIHSPINQDRKMYSSCKKGQLLINIRANCSPDFLEELTERILNETSDKYGIFMANKATECFAPSYPKPVHRL